MSDSQQGDAPLVSVYADDPDMAELVVEFVSELDDRVAALQTALDADDLVALRRMAHQLKGAGGGYGFPSITETASDLERACDNFSGDIAGVREGTQELIELCNRASA
ncbi:MAG: Hpt domain-containing protein [Planctomycetota bacterium]